ncbi:MAG: hypothetical protein K8U57_04170 [Planctomycetes bacterium]|nr:hypothetical protein [Planctomycetota bacterium]
MLENKFGEHGEGLGVKVTPEDLAAQAQAAIPDEGEERPEPISPSAAAEPDPPKSERDEYARRAVLTSILGLMIPPVAGYALYLYMNATFGEGEISRTGQLNRSIALVLALAGLAWLPFYFTFLLDM